MSNPISFRLQALSVDYFNVINHKAATEKDGIVLIGVPLNLGFDISINVGINGEMNLVQFKLNIKINCPFQGSKYWLAEIETAFDFIVDNLFEYSRGGNNFELPPSLLNTFYSIAYSTTRGLLLGQLNGTFLSGTILPLVSMQAVNFRKQPPNEQLNVL